MRKNQTKILILEFITLIFLILNILIKKRISEYSIVVFLLISLLISIFLIGFEKRSELYEKEKIKFITLYTISSLMLIYGIGLAVGYLSTSYSLTLKDIISNSLPIFFIVILEELYRYNICTKGENNRIIIYTSVLIFILVDVSLIVSNYNLSDLSDILKLLTVVICPSLFKNIMLTNFSKKHGFKICMVYQLIINLYVYIVPIFPNLNEYLESIIMSFLPICILLLFNLQFEKTKQSDIRDKHIVSKIISAIIIIFLIIIVCLFSNLFSWWIAIVGSGSMTPTINIGDAIVIDKIKEDELSKLKVGDILVFRVSTTMYTHRIVNIDVNNDEYYISTKGDRKGNLVDNWTVKNKDVIGIVKFKIPYIGRPTVWLNNLLKEVKNE